MSDEPDPVEEYPIRPAMHVDVSFHRDGERVAPPMFVCRSCGEPVDGSEPGDRRGAFGESVHGACEKANPKKVERADRALAWWEQTVVGRMLNADEPVVLVLTLSPRYRDWSDDLFARLLAVEEKVYGGARSNPGDSRGELPRGR
jgi:hypothetical protein